MNVNLKWYFEEFKMLYKTKKSLEWFLEKEDIMIWYELMREYRPKAANRKRNWRKWNITWKLVADAVFSDYIRLSFSDMKWKVACVTCWGVYDWKKIQAGHYRQRGASKFRYDVRNVHPQCYTCNITLQWNYRDYGKFMERTYGIEMDDYIYKSDSAYKFRDWEYQDIIMDWYLAIQQLPNGKKPKYEVGGEEMMWMYK